MKKLRAETNQLTQLRKQAQARMQGEVLETSDKSPDGIRKLIHELQAHQIELEMQNDKAAKSHNIFRRPHLRGRQWCSHGKLCLDR